jgi:flagellar basal-body rod protein FlgB
MSRSTQRHSLLSANLANVNTPNYKRQDLDFAITLQKESGRLAERPLARTDHANPRLDGNTVNLEQEVVGLAETELRYQALTEITARYFSGLKNVIREGR